MTTIPIACSILIIRRNVKKALSFLQVWTVFGQKFSVMTVSFGKN